MTTHTEILENYKRTALVNDMSDHTFTMIEDLPNNQSHYYLFEAPFLKALKKLKKLSKHGYLIRYEDFGHDIMIELYVSDKPVKGLKGHIYVYETW